MLNTQMLNIDELIKIAMKNHNDTELNVYRLIKSEILLYKTAKNAKPYDESSEINLLKKMVKSRKESILMYSEASRKDLVVKEEDELAVLEKLIPATPSLSEIENFLQKYISESNFAENGKIAKNQMGNVIKYLKSNFPTADGKDVSNLVKKYIL